MPAKQNSIYTIGHSTRPIDDFIAMLTANNIDTLADIRTIPKSRYNPQFNGDALAASLAVAGIKYVPIKGLGGLRHARKDSPNMGWHNASFRGYADYMQTPEFQEALGGLIALSKKHTVAIMCAESVPWRCHRSLVSDALIVRHVPVEHIMSATKNNPHKLTPFAVVQGSKITYPPEEPDLFAATS